MKVRCWGCPVAWGQACRAHQKPTPEIRTPGDRPPHSEDRLGLTKGYPCRLAYPIIRTPVDWGIRVYWGTPVYWGSRLGRLQRRPRRGCEMRHTRGWGNGQRRRTLLLVHKLRTLRMGNACIPHSTCLNSSSPTDDGVRSAPGLLLILQPMLARVAHGHGAKPAHEWAPVSTRAMPPNLNYYESHTRLTGNNPWHNNSSFLSFQFLQMLNIWKYQKQQNGQDAMISMQERFLRMCCFGEIP